MAEGTGATQLSAVRSVLAAASIALGACGGARAVVPPIPPAPAGSPAAAAPPPLSSGAADGDRQATAPPNGVGSPAPVAPTPAPASTVANAKTDESWVSCHQSFRASAKDVSRDVAAMAKACEKPTGMKLLGKTITGKQADEDKPQSFGLDAKASHCYRVYAQAADGIKDLDLAIKDSAGVVVGQDSTDDPSPVLLENGAVCFTKDDKATLVVSVGMGSGVYAVQIWQD
jgi:hypothetical protein